jgi:hypothetical protein
MAEEAFMNLMTDTMRNKTQASAPSSNTKGAASFLSNCLLRLTRLAGTALLVLCGTAQAFTLHVVDGDGNALNGGFRWMLEEDTTHLTLPGVATNDSISLVIHKSHAPVVAHGSSTNSPVAIPADSSMRFILSVLADGYASGGQTVAAGQDSVTVILN